VYPTGLGAEGSRQSNWDPRVLWQDSVLVEIAAVHKSGGVPDSRGAVGNSTSERDQLRLNSPIDLLDASSGLPV
jgi:hypothetical protein